MMDLHPMIVHTPIAFLTVYAVLEILTCISRLRKSHTFFVIKFFLLAVGSIGSLVAVASGENAQNLNQEFLNQGILHKHGEYAEMTRNIFAVLSFVYLTMITSMYPKVKGYVSKLSRKLSRAFDCVGKFFIQYYVLVIILAITGLITVSITGALGGGLVFGKNAKDPFIKFVLEKVCGEECL